MNCKRWVQQVDRLMRRDFRLSVADAGLDEADLSRLWREGNEPAAFVEWFAAKYDLTRFTRSPYGISL